MCDSNKPGKSEKGPLGKCEMRLCWSLITHGQRVLSTLFILSPMAPYSCFRLILQLYA